MEEEEAKLNDVKSRIKNQFVLDKTQADARKILAS